MADEGTGLAGMLTLALDTCTPEGVLALGYGGDLIAEARFAARKGATGSLVPLVDSLTRSEGFTPASLELVAVGVGPGTFTGVKVGVATAKALALALGIPLLGMGTLDILAAGAPRGGSVLAAVDAGQGMLYAALYRDGAGLERATEYLYVSPPELAAVVEESASGEIVLAGAAPEALAAALEERDMPFRRGQESIVASAMLRLAARASAEADPLGALSVRPLYLKRPA